MDREYWTKQRRDAERSSMQRLGAATSTPGRSGCSAKAELKRLEVARPPAL